MALFESCNLLLLEILKRIQLHERALISGIDRRIEEVVDKWGSSQEVSNLVKLRVRSAMQHYYVRRSTFLSFRLTVA